MKRRIRFDLVYPHRCSLIRGNFSISRDERSSFSQKEINQTRGNFIEKYADRRYSAALHVQNTVYTET